MKNKLKIGQKVKYQGQEAVVVGFGKPFGDYPVVVLEFKAIFANFGKNYKQVEQRSVIEHGLEII